MQVPGLGPTLLNQTVDFNPIPEYFTGSLSQCMHIDT